MTWTDAFTIAGRELRRRTGRAILTVLAIALAAALLSALLTIAGTARTRVLSQLSHGGSLAGITVEPNAPDPSQETLDNPVPGPPRPITARAVAQMSRLKGVLHVYTVTAEQMTIVPPADLPPGSTLCPAGGGAATQQPPCSGQPFGSTLVSADLGNVSQLPITLLAGRLPTAHSTVEVDATLEYLQHLGLSRSRADEVVGSRLTLVNLAEKDGLLLSQRLVVEIVGVVDEQAGSGSLVAWPSLTDREALFASAAGAAAAVAAGGTASPGFASDGQSPAPRPAYTAAVVIAKQLNDVAAVRAGLAAIGYSSTAPVGLIVSVGRYLHVVELVLSGIGLVALAIAALGIANALFAAIRERRREIGVMKAIGARDRDVLRVFLVEAVFLGLLGGVIGTVLGIVMAAAIAANANAYLHSEGLAGVALSIPWLLPAGAVAGSALVALLAGVFPALRAARLPARAAVDI